VTSRGDDGQSLIETIILSLLFFVPLIWAIGVLADLHKSALAATAAAREAGFEAARASSAEEARQAVARAVSEAFVNHGITPGDAQIDVSMSGFERGESIEVRVGYPVTVLQAPLLGRVAGPSVWVNASHVAIIDPYRSRD
jgi:hypothetical protein